MINTNTNTYTCAGKRFWYDYILSQKNESMCLHFQPAPGNLAYPRSAHRGRKGVCRTVAGKSAGHSRWYELFHSKELPHGPSPGWHWRRWGWNRDRWLPQCTGHLRQMLRRLECNRDLQRGQNAAIWMGLQQNQSRNCRSYMGKQ